MAVSLNITSSFDLVSMWKKYLPVLFQWIQLNLECFITSNSFYLLFFICKSFDDRKAFKSNVMFLISINYCHWGWVYRWQITTKSKSVFSPFLSGMVEQCACLSRELWSQIRSSCEFDHCERANSSSPRETGVFWSQRWYMVLNLQTSPRSEEGPRNCCCLYQ